ncbi:MAG: LamG domain-containing protein [Patescibacteria group bacterium]
MPRYNFGPRTVRTASRTRVVGRTIKVVTLGVGFILMTSLALAFFSTQTVLNSVELMSPRQTVNMAASVTTTIATTTLDVGLKGCWKFDEGTGNTTKNSVNNKASNVFYHGQTSDLWTANAGNSPWVSNKSNNNININALRFSGYRSYSYLDNSFQDVGGNKITVSYWLKLDKSPSEMIDPSTNQPVKYPGVISKAGSYVHYFGTAAGWGATHPVKDKLIIKYFDTTGASHDGFNVSSFVLATGTWYHIAWVFNGSSTRSKLYIDGELNNDVVILKPINPIASQLMLGSFANSPAGLTIDDLKIYQRALSDEEIQNLNNELYDKYYEAVVDRCVTAGSYGARPYENYSAKSCSEDLMNIPAIIYDTEPIASKIKDAFNRARTTLKVTVKATADSTAKENTGFMGVCIPYATKSCYLGYASCIKRGVNPDDCKYLESICLANVKGTCLGWPGLCTSGYDKDSYEECMKVPNSVYCPSGIPTGDAQTCSAGSGGSGCGCTNFEPEYKSRAVASDAMTLCLAYRAPGWSIGGGAGSPAINKKHSDEFLCKTANLNPPTCASLGNWPHKQGADIGINAVDIFFDKCSAKPGVCDAFCIKAGHDFAWGRIPFMYYSRLSAIDELTWSYGDKGHIHFSVKRRGVWSKTTNEPCFQFTRNDTTHAPYYYPEGAPYCTNAASYR